MLKDCPQLFGNDLLKGVHWDVNLIWFSIIVQNNR